MDHGWRDIAPPEEALYDLIFDPNEANNLVESEGYASVLNEMRDRLNGWMRETDDPLPRGRVPAPEGVVANDPDDISPRDPTRQLHESVS